MKTQTFEQYCFEHHLPTELDLSSLCHGSASPAGNNTKGNKLRAAKAFKQLADKVDAAKSKYVEACAAGQIIPPPKLSRIEGLILRANALNQEAEATKAAQRILSKLGIVWE